MNSSDERQNLLAAVRAARGGARFFEARDLLLAALRAEPTDARLHFALGGVYRDMGETREAAGALRLAVKLEPGFAAAHFNLANALRMTGDIALARHHYLAAAELEPGEAGHWINLGGALRAMGRIDEALEATARALEIEPGNSSAKWNRAQMLLLAGRFAEGWAAFDSRWSDGPMNFRYRDFPAPLWDGGPLAGKTILVWGEQGIGDEMVMGSLLAEIRATAGAVVFECEPRLVPLFARAYPDIDVIARRNPHDPGTHAAAIDCQAPLGDVAGHLRGARERFKPTPGYLKAEPARTEELRARMGALGPGAKIGISWRSANPLYKDSVDTALELWRPVIETAGVHFVSVQYGDPDIEIAAMTKASGVQIHGHADIDAWNDIDAWAAQIAAMDLVISVSNSAACLAGALGVPVWQLLPMAPEFYWLGDGTETLWFQSMRLFRQSQPGDWPGVMAEVAAALAGFSKS